MRVFQLAKELGLNKHKLVTMIGLRGLISGGVTAMSSLTEEDIEKVRISYAEDPNPESESASSVVDVLRLQPRTYEYEVLPVEDVPEPPPRTLTEVDERVFDHDGELPFGWGRGWPNVPALEMPRVSPWYNPYGFARRLQELKKLNPDIESQATLREIEALAKDPKYEISVEARDCLFAVGSELLPTVRLLVQRFGVYGALRAMCGAESLAGALVGPWHEWRGLVELRHALAVCPWSEYLAARAYARGRVHEMSVRLGILVGFLLNDPELIRQLPEGLSIGSGYFDELALCTLRDTDLAPYLAQRVASVKPHDGNVRTTLLPAILRNLGVTAAPLLFDVALGNDNRELKYGFLATDEPTLLAEAVHFFKDHQLRRGFFKRLEEQPALVPEIAAILDGDAREAAKTARRLLPGVHGELVDQAAMEDVPAVLRDVSWKRKRERLVRIKGPVPTIEYAESVAPPATVPLPVWAKRRSAEQTRELLNYPVMNYVPDGGIDIADLLPLDDEAFRLVVRHLPGDAWRSRHNQSQAALLTKFGLDALELFNKLAAEAVIDFVGEADAPRIAEVVSRGACSLRPEVRNAAEAWLDRHPRAAVIGLLPALGSDDDDRRFTARVALGRLVERGHQKVLREVGQEAGGEFSSLLAQLAERTSLDVSPTRVTLPPELHPRAITPPRLVSGGVLPAEALTNLVAMWSFSTPSRPYPGLFDVQAACDQGSLEQFALSLFDLWCRMGHDPRFKWAVLNLAIFGGNDTVLKVVPTIRKWHREGGTKRAQYGVDVLAAIGTERALMELVAIADQSRKRGLREHAERAVAAVARARGLSRDELGDRAIPRFRLREDGSDEFDYGTRSFVVRFDHELKPVIRAADGLRKTMPKPGKTDGDGASEEYERFRALKKGVAATARHQINRLELAMVEARRWAGADFTNVLLGQPLLLPLLQRLVLRAEREDGTAFLFYVNDDRIPANLEDEPVDLEHTSVEIPHPVTMSAKERRTWGDHFGALEVLQPFEQLDRPVFGVGDLAEFPFDIPAAQWVFGLERRGWKRNGPMDAGSYDTHDKVGCGFHAWLKFEGCLSYSSPPDDDPIRIEELLFAKHAGIGVTASDVAPTFLSEVIRDICQVVQEVLCTS